MKTTYPGLYIVTEGKVRIGTPDDADACDWLESIAVVAHSADDALAAADRYGRGEVDGDNVDLAIAGYAPGTVIKAIKAPEEN